MKKMCIMIAAAALMLLTGGCLGGTSRVSIDPPYERQISMDGSPAAANVVAYNRGVYLFNCVPVWSGFPNLPNRRRYKLFRNYVKEGYNVFMIEEGRGKKYRNCEVADVHSKYHSTGIYSLWIFWNRSLETRAVLITPKKSGDKDAVK